jgi:hypothetical protein
MANITPTTIDNASIELQDGEFQDELLTFGAADTFVKGTILARKAVVTAITPVAGANTGNGTCTVASVVEGPDVPLVGSYVLACVTAVTHGGVFKLTDPNGKIVGTGLAMTAGAGVATIIEVAGLIFTLTDGSTDFIAGDSFTLPVVADGKLVPFNPAGVGGAQKPIAVLTYEVSLADAGNLPIRALVKGRVNKTRLVIDADGDGDNVTAAIVDQLRATGITAVPVQQLSELDNL